MHYVKKAVIMAAGIGKRMQPASLITPKPLISVNGKRMIETAIDALHNNGIDEIYIVTGYLKEQFWVLEEKYEGLVFIDNPYYETCNNIASLYVARDHLENSVILDGDQIINNPLVFEPGFEKSGYNAVKISEESDEWIMQVKDGKVISCSRTGGNKGWQLYSISRWTESDGRLLAGLVEKEFESGNTQIYWDDVPMFCHFDKFELGIREMAKDDVIEIDSYEELKQLDPLYK